jgi:hypothetical protein
MISCATILLSKGLLFLKVSSFVVFVVTAADVIHCGSKHWSFNTVNNKDSQPADIILSH